MVRFMVADSKGPLAIWLHRTHQGQVPRLRHDHIIREALHPLHTPMDLH
jgi:hypothetical protein